MFHLIRLLLNRRPGEETPAETAARSRGRRGAHAAQALRQVEAEAPTVPAARAVPTPRPRPGYEYAVPTLQSLAAEVMWCGAIAEDRRRTAQARQREVAEAWAAGQTEVDGLRLEADQLERMARDYAQFLAVALAAEERRRERAEELERQAAGARAEQERQAQRITASAQRAAAPASTTRRDERGLDDFLYGGGRPPTAPAGEPAAATTTQQMPRINGSELAGGAR